MLSRYNIGVIIKRFYGAINPKIPAENIPIISCRRTQYDCYAYQKYDKLEEIKLTSKGWHHRKSQGDYFILHAVEDIVMFDHHDFTDLGLSQHLTNILLNNNTKPTIIQSKVIPVIMSGQNTLIAAETGCGKTLAYLLPVLDQICLSKSQQLLTEFNCPLSLIMAPSRELAFQIADVASDYTGQLGVLYDVIVGGGTKKKIMNPNFKELDLLIATPGAVSKLFTTGIYKTTRMSHVVLDEADTLLDDSFSEKISYLLKKFSFHYSKNEKLPETQLTLVSATMPSAIPQVLKEIILPDSLTRITTDRLHYIPAHIPQRFLRIGKSRKPAQLLQMLKANQSKHDHVIIFSNKSSTCDWISMFLNENGVKCVHLNGDMPLTIRKQLFSEFSRGDVHVISCTDVGSRGLDTTRVKHVINYDFPKFTADYVHRCGRTGRIGSPSNSHITNFISTSSEIDLVQKIEMAFRKTETIPFVNGNISSVIRNRLIHRKKIQIE